MLHIHLKLNVTFNFWGFACVTECVETIQKQSKQLSWASVCFKVLFRDTGDVVVKLRSDVFVYIGLRMNVEKRVAVWQARTDTFTLAETLIFAIKHILVQVIFITMSGEFHSILSTIKKVL